MSIIDELEGIVGAAHVLTGKDAEKWSHDWTNTYVGAPIAAVRPACAVEVSKIIKLANRTGTPVVPVSGNTGLAGGTFAKDAVAVSLERMNKIREIRADARLAVVEAGVVLANLHEAADAHDLAFPLTFGARGSAMIGGVLSTNAGGSNVVRYGNTRDLCLGIEVVTPSGEIVNLMSELHKDNSGYNLKHLMIGAEGTLGLITAAVVKLVAKPAAYATAMVAVPSLDDALGLLNELQRVSSGGVEAYEYMPRTYIDVHVGMFAEAREPFDNPYECNIMVEIGAISAKDAQPDADGSIPAVAQLEDTLATLMERGIVLDAVVAKSETQRTEMWKRREDAAEVLLTKTPMINSDIAVPLDQVATFLRKMKERLKTVDPKASDTCVTHLGDGNIHYIVYQSDIALTDAITEKIEETAKELGGSFSAEHGIGLTKKPSMARRKDPAALGVMRAIKTALDPNNIMNPGKVLPD